MNSHALYQYPISCIQKAIVITITILIITAFSQINPVATATTQQVISFLQKAHGSTTNAKLAFVNVSGTQHKLCYIDFSENSSVLKIHSITKALGARVPVISPDGKWIVYAVGEGAEAGSPVSKRSSVYMCSIAENAEPILIKADSACEPRFMQNANTMSVLYSTLAPNFAWEGFGKTMNVEIDISSATPSIGSPTEFFSYGSYTGGLSYDKKYLCAGGGTIAMIDLQSGKKKPDTVALFSQSCNASISSSRIFTNTMMHLTTDGSHPLINSGKKWSAWQVILINNNKRELYKGFWYPTTFQFSLNTNPESWTGVAKWHHCEWSNHPYFATASLVADRYFKKDDAYVNTKYHERIYCINLKDSTYLEILRPDTIRYNNIEDDESGLQWPWLWVDIPKDFVENSQWLKSGPTATKSEQNNSMNNSTHLTITKSLITAPFMIQHIELYTLNGKQIATYQNHTPAQWMTIPQQTLTSQGVFLVRIFDYRGACFTKHVSLLP